MTLSKKILEGVEISEHIKTFFTDNFQEKEFSICLTGFDWLIANFGYEKFNAWDVIQKLEAEKDSEDYSKWLFESFKLTGTCRGWHENNNLQFVHNYKNGKPHGNCRSWHENGKLQYKYNYKNGKPHGICHGRYENGNRKNECNYKNGKPHGLCRDWDENRKLLINSYYKKGKLIIKEEKK